MNERQTTRLWFAAIAMGLVPVGFFTKVYAGPGAEWIAGSAGGVFYVMFWVFLVLVVWPGLSPAFVSAATLAVTCAIEFLQLWHPPFLESVRGTFVGQTILGSTFSWADFPPYVMGGVLAWLAGRYVLRRTTGGITGSTQTR